MSAPMDSGSSTAGRRRAMFQLTTVIITSSAAGIVATTAGSAHHKCPINRPYQTFMTSPIFPALVVSIFNVIRPAWQ